MNKFYKVVFCKTTGVMKAVSETAKSGKKTKSISIAAGVLSAGVIFSSTAFAAAGDPLIEGEALGYQALSVGEDNIVDGNRSTAVGNNNNINGESNTAIGSGNMIRPTEIYWWDGEQEEITLRPSISSTVVGLENTIVGNESIASGLFNRVDGDNVTVTGGRNNVVARESGAYGQNNSISAQAIVPMFYRVDDGMALRMKPTYAISSGSYAYGNGNEVVGDKSHTVGNSNSLSGEDNGVLGNGNILASGDSGFNEPTARLGSEFGVRSIGWDSNGSFLVGNQNEVTANNTHAVGNQNTIRNDRNVTIGNHNTVEFYDYDDGFSNERRISNDNTSTAIVGEDNLISAAGVHIVGTENNIDQKNSYVMGGDNYISRVDGIFSESARDGSNVFGTNNSVYAQSSSILGSQNAIFEDSHLAVVAGSENRVTGVMSSVVGSQNEIEKDMGGAHGVANRVIGNSGIIRLIEEAMIEAEELGEFQGIDIDGDGIKDITTLTELERFQVEVLTNGSYAYGNMNNIAGENVQSLGNNNELSGDNNIGVGSNNRIGKVGGMVGDSDAVLETIKFDGSAAYGDSNIIDAASAQTIGNNNLVGKSRSSVTGYDNKVVNGEYKVNPDATLEEQNLSGTTVSGNSNLVSGNKGHLVGNSNILHGDDLRAFGDNNVIGKPRSGGVSDENSNNQRKESSVYGNNNLVQADSSHIVGNDNKIADPAFQGEYALSSPLPVESLVVGNKNNVIGSHSSVVGSNNSMFGNNNNVSGRDNVVGAEILDRLPPAQDEDSNVVGNFNTVFSGSSNVMGNNNITKGGGEATAIGANNAVYAYSSGVIGESNQLGRDEIIVDGELTDSIYSISNAYVLGNKNVISGIESHTVGNNNTSKGQHATVVGTNNQVSAHWSNVSGHKNEVGDIYIDANDGMYNSNVAINGNWNNVQASDVTVSGNQNRVVARFGGAVGDKNIVGEQGSLYEPERFRVTTGAYALGSQNEVYGEKAIVVGTKNMVSGDDSHVLGANNNLEEGSNDTSSVGNGNQIAAADSGVQGNRNTIEKTYEYDEDVVGSYITGNDNTISVSDAFIVGNKSTVGSQNSVVVGNESTIGDYAENSAILGASNAIQGSNSAAVGSGNTVEERNSGVLGNDNYIQEEPQFFKVDGERYIRGGSYAIGNTNSLFGSDSHVLGNNNSLESRGAVAIGNDNRVNYNGQNSAVLGHSNNVEGYSSTTTGSNNSINADFTFTAGNENQVASSDSSVIGHNNTVGYQQPEVARSIGDGESDSNNNVTGNNNTILASDNSVFGNSNTSDANGAIIVGTGNTVDIYADDSIILGSNASSTVVGGVAIGNGSVADRLDSVSVGSAGSERQIINVADGTQDKDAVNLGQLKASVRDTTSGKNITATRTDTGYEVALNDAITLDSVTTGNTVVNTDGVRAGDVFLSSTTGLDNAGNRVTSVGDATLRSDAVNYGQFTDGLAGTIKSVTGDENITATTDADKNVSLVLNKDLVADSLTAGDTVINNAGFTNGATTLGNAGLKVGDVTVSSAGLDNAGNRVTSVGNAIEDTDAVNYGQFKAGITDTTAGKNIAVKRTDTGYEVSTVEDMTLTSVKTGDTIINNAGFTNGATTVGGAGLKVGDVTVSNVGLDNAGNRVTSVGDATLRSDAVNYGQFTDGLAGTIKSVTGDENITATTDAEKNVSLVLNRDLDVDSVTAGSNVFDSSGLQIGGVTIGDEVGIYAGDMRVRGVADAVEATDAVNLGQVSVIDDRLTNENIAQNTIITNNTNAINKGFNVGNGVTSNKFELGDTVDITAGKNSKVTTTDTGVEVSVADDLVVTTVTTGNTLVNTDGVRAGDVFLSATTGLDNAGNRVTSVGDGEVRSDAVNYGQFTDGLAGTIKSVTGDENITATTDANKNVSLVLNKDIAIDSMTAGDTLINNAGFTNGATTVGGAGLKVGDVTVSNVGLDNAGNRVTSVGDATLRSDAVNYGQFQDGLDGTIKSVTGDENITATTDANKNVSLVLNKDITVDSVMAGSNVFNTDGLNVGSVNISNESGIYAGNKKVSGVADATNRDDAVNYGQFQDGLNGLTKTTVDGDENITSTKNATGYDVTLNKDVKVDSVTAGNTIINNDGFTNGATTVGNTGLKVGDVTVSSAGLDNAGNRVTSVGDATLRSDAVNYGQFTDGLAGTIKSVTGDENITATTDANKNVSLVLNKDITVDSMTAGNTVINDAGFTNGATTLGNTGLKVGDVTVSSVGLDNAGNRVTSVGDAILRSDAVNYGQFTDGLAGTIKSVTGDENIIATTDAEKNVTLNLKKDILVDSMTAGDTIVNSDGMTIGNTFYGSTGVRTGDVILSNTSGLYNAGYRVTGVGRAVEGMDAVNFDQFNEALNKITPTTIDGDKNITVTNKGTGYDIALNDNLTADSVTTGGTTVNNDGLTTGDVTVSSNGLSNGGNRVTNIGDAVEGSDAVSFDQFNKKFDSIVPTDIKGDENITVTKTDNGFDIGLNKDITADSVTVGNTSITSDGLTVGNVTVGAGGLNNGGNTVKGVGDGVLRDDAVNKGQLDDLEVRQNIKNEAQDIIINNKLDRDEFLKDQERQDALLEGKADKAELEKTNANVSNNTTNINKHSDILEAHDKELGRLEDVKADKAELDKTNIKVQDNADKNKDQDKTLGEHKTELERLEDVKADKKDLEAKADKTYVDKEITATNDRFSEINKENNSKFEKFEKAQSNIDSSQNVRIDRNEQAIADLGYQVDNLEGKLSAGIASSVAMASMPSSFIKGEARIAGGFGYYNGQNAIAIGITGATETGDYSYKLGSSYTQEGGAVVGAGISYRLW